MSKIHVCDRCGDRIEGRPYEQVGTKSGLDSPAGKIIAKDNSSGGFSPQLGPRGSNCTAKVDGGDLCEDCGQAFEDWWNNEG